MGQDASPRRLGLADLAGSDLQEDLPLGLRRQVRRTAPGVAGRGVEPPVLRFRRSLGECAERRITTDTLRISPCHVSKIYMHAANQSQADQDALRAALIEAEYEYQDTRTYDYIARVIRDGLIVNAHRGGISQKEISALVGDIGQPNVARAQRRAITRRDVVPGGMLAADDAQERSGLSPAAFMSAVRAGRIQPRLTGSPGVWAFNPEDVDPSRFSGG
jgi:hypothetical protein